ncbi:hypothetical protein PCH_Pc20g06730 [Penicillium rubens Wisconsin 54-1255]|jgi:hypothetical protein|uniref:Uncharacterized protein n=1 Tax=Penicillium rubens (strain ATCC 28089 / DSM 1075 / NRRL 1951 / Wisconsin 54-1255) TaxID=500485 RepID=B6HH79_PENRW|nr:hypothetical protein PCH_Pc20g06730 [Penicillium rubens Wisconsin 54-1255]
MATPWFLFRKVGCGSWSWRRVEFPRVEFCFMGVYEFEKAQKLGFHSPNRESLGASAEGQSPGFKTEAQQLWRLDSCHRDTNCLCAPLALPHLPEQRVIPT